MKSQVTRYAKHLAEEVLARPGEAAGLMGCHLPGKDGGDALCRACSHGAGGCTLASSSPAI